MDEHQHKILVTLEFVKVISQVRKIETHSIISETSTEVEQEERKN
jgi:hypothetical protein